MSLLPQHTSHSNPFDGLLAMQALMEQTAIIGGDAQLDLYGVLLRRHGPCRHGPCNMAFQGDEQFA